MKKVFWKRAVKILSLVLAVVLVLLVLQEYVFRDYWQFGQASLRLKGFYQEPRDSLDVVLIGDSAVYAGYSPAYAYAETGLASYSLAIGSNVCVTWRPLVEEILSRQKPDLIVIEIGSATYRDLQQKYETTPTIHILLDNMPMNGNRIRTIQREVVGRYHDNPLEYYLPFIRYHNDWRSIGNLMTRAEEMFAWKYSSRNVLKGTIVRQRVVPAPEDLVDMRDDRGAEPISADSEEVLRDFLSFCRENDVNVLFISSPMRISAGENEAKLVYRANYAGQIAQEYGFDYVNFQYYFDEIGLDPERDFYNDPHLNYHGQMKYTAFLSRFLIENCGVHVREQTEENHAVWERSADYVQRLYAYLDTLDETYGEAIIENRETMRILDAMGPVTERTG